jgi:hypothetical protein
MAYLREKTKCPGCRGEEAHKPPTRKNCLIKNYETVKNNKSGFCFECPEYPCKRLIRLDKRYRTKYGMSMIDNLEFIKGKGLAAFIEKEKERWKCSKCGGIVCVHRGYCLECGANYHWLKV